jgi:hypothetical protein
MRKITIVTAFIFSVLLLSCKKENQIKKETTAALISDTLQIQDSIKPLTKNEADLLKKLIDDEIDEQEYTDLDVKNSPYSVSFPNEDDRYTVYFSVLFSDDLNQDGIMDYIVLRDSEGMLGGSANTNQEYLFIIMKDENSIQEKHSILGYSPGSYNTLDKADFKNKKLTIEATQNYRTYSSEDLQSTSLSFVYKNGNVYEESYLSACALAKIKSKTIFKPIAPVKSRFRSIDMHNYTETIHEVYQTKDTLIEADLTGCDNLSLTFDTHYKMTKEQQEDFGYKKSVAMKLLQFLAKNTQFSETIKVLLDYYGHNDLTDEFVEVKDIYSFRILIQKEDSDKNRLRYLLQINKMDNPNQSENWEVTTRQK